VIITEQSKQVSILEVREFVRKCFPYLVHTLLVVKHISKSKVHGVVHSCIEGTTLISTHVINTRVINFTYLENTSALCVLAPEIFCHLLGCINSDSIEAIGFYLFLHPIF